MHTHTQRHFWWICKHIPFNLIDLSKQFEENKYHFSIEDYSTILIFIVTLYPDVFFPHEGSTSFLFVFKVEDKYMSSNNSWIINNFATQVL